jgi:dihydroxyacetone kinase phosphotransfer subunit
VTGPRVALVLVSHSAQLAAGVAEVAAQMAPDTTVIAVGGTGDGGLGTSYEAISDALARADSEAGVIVLYDLGSARLTAETALEFADPDAAARAEIVDAPLVEGALAAATRAQIGGTRAEVAAAARSAAAPETGTEITGRREADGSTGPAGLPGPQGLKGPLHLKGPLRCAGPSWCATRWACTPGRPRS